MRMSESIAKRIRFYLDAKGITQYKLGKLTAISHSTIQGILDAKYTAPNSKNLFLIIKAFNLTVSEFFNDEMFDLDSVIIE